MFFSSLPLIYIHPHTLCASFIFFHHTQKASLIAAIGAFTLSTLSLLLMSICPTFVIQLSLLCSLLWSAILAVCCFTLLPYPTNVIGGCVCIVTLLLSLCYTLVIWKRIPFASANLYTGIQAIKTNAGCILVVYVLVLLSIGYSLLWMTAVVGVYDITKGLLLENYIYLAHQIETTQQSTKITMNTKVSVMMMIMDIIIK